MSSVGKFVDRFEQQLADSIGAKRAIAVVNGTAALHICLRLVGVEQDDEVLIPALTFGAIPHFVDSEESTLGLDPRKLASYLDSIAEVKTTGCFNIKTGRRIKAVIPVHTFGHPVDMDPLVELCDRYCLALVEDAAESLGSLYKGRHTGNWGKVSALSFNGNKIITTGGGGAILTNDDSLADKAKHLTTTARVPHRWEIDHDMVGYNYRLPNLNAALGCAQLDQLPAFVQKKRALATRYQQAFQGVKGMRFFAESDFAQSNYWLNVLLLDDDHTGDRDKIIERTNSNGIMTRPAWRLMHELPMYSSMPRMDLAVAEELEKRIINIPSSSFLV